MKASWKGQAKICFISSDKETGSLSSPLHLYLTSVSSSLFNPRLNLLHQHTLSLEVMVTL